MNDCCITITACLSLIPVCFELPVTVFQISYFELTYIRFQSLCLRIIGQIKLPSRFYLDYLRWYVHTSWSFIYFNAYTVAQVAKLERHLSLLRQEYVKLQNRLIDVEKKYSLAVAASGHTAGEHENTFVNRLLRTVAELYDKDLYRCVKLFFCI